MNTQIRITCFLFTVVCLTASVACADSARELTRQGNQLYRVQQFELAAEAYEEALETEDLPAARFNKANALYQTGDYDSAIELYNQIAAEGVNRDLSARAKFNVANSLYHRGIAKTEMPAQPAAPVATDPCQPPQSVQQTGPDYAGAIADLKSAVKQWRASLTMKPRKLDAARNIEIAKNKIRQLKQQQQQQDQDQNNQNDQDQQDQQQDNQQQNQQNQKDQQEQQQQDEKQQQDQEQEQQQQQDQQQDQQQFDPPDTTAEDILEKEKKQREQRQIQIYGPVEVEKDW